jgi:SH3-like domain-containing protein
MQVFRAMAVVLVVTVSLPAWAQTSPPAGVLTLPKKPAGSALGAAAPTVTPQTAPVAPVQQVAPFVSPPAPAGPAKPYVPDPHAPATAAPLHKLKKPPPVVQAPPNVHAQKPAAAKTAKPAAPTVAAPPVAAAPAVEPTVGDATAKPAETKGSVTQLPLPRWASLRADEVNLRVGPGLKFPIDWQYHRRDLPVKILREIEVWRLVQDQDGVKGWVHSATLTGRRSFVVTNFEATLRATAAEDAAAVARLKPGVVGRIRACDAAAAWCEVQVAGYKGFLRRDQFFGVDPGEAVGN